MATREGISRQMSDRMRTAAFIILSGGFQDAYTYCGRGGVFANAQTGNVVLMSSNFFSGRFAAGIKYLVPIAAFLLGTAVAECVHRKWKYYRALHWRQIVLACEMAILFAVGFLPQEANALANALVSFVCALQVQAFHKVRGHVYASTMCIGNMRSGVEALIGYFHGRDKAQRRRAATYFTVILLFALGAGIGCIAAKRFGEKAIWVCCGLLAVSFAFMFQREPGSTS